MRSLSIILLYLILMPGVNELKAQDSPFLLKFDYTADLVHNARGGLQQGTVYMGRMMAGAGFNTEKAGWWKGGSFYISAHNTHGGMASGSLVGDVLGVSTIENVSCPGLYELWYLQSYDRFSVLLGLNDLNEIFATNTQADHFMNRAFGMHGNLRLNSPMSVFPKTGLGMVFNYFPTSDLSMKLAVYDGNPGSLEDDPYNIKWNLYRQDGFLFFGEVDYSLYASGDSRTGQAKRYKLGTYKMGAYYHTGEYAHQPEESASKGNYAFYLLVDQVIVPRTPHGGRQVSAFLQLSWSTEYNNRASSYMGAGVNIGGFLFNKGQDNLGIGIAHVELNEEIVLYKAAALPGLNQSFSFETALDFSYKVQVNKYIALQTDLQYIIHPGSSPALENAIVPSLRIQIGITN